MDIIFLVLGSVIGYGLCHLEHRWELRHHREMERHWRRMNGTLRRHLSWQRRSYEWWRDARVNQPMRVIVEHPADVIVRPAEPPENDTVH